MIKCRVNHRICQTLAIKPACEKLFKTNKVMTLLLDLDLCRDLPYKIVTLVLIGIDQTVVQGSFPAWRSQSRTLSLGYRSQSPRGHSVARAVPVLSAAAPAVRSTGSAATAAAHCPRARPGDGPRCTTGLLLLLPSAWHDWSRSCTSEGQSWS